jgi:processive 1,2-diacylglycerol beta-glucosyltransferase
VLIISASMGAGHDGAAREMQSRLRRAGHDAEVHDFLDAAPLRIGGVVRRSYEIELRHAPGAYDRTYQLWYRAPWLCPIVSWFVCLLTRRRVLRWVRRQDADVVVSTYPLATLCLGRLRAIGRLRIPTVNFITDFGVHPLWVHRGIDLNLAVHRVPAEEASRRTGRPAVACGPLVADSFGPSGATARTRERMRADLGLAAGDKAVLIVAGSWGIGDVEETFDSVLAMDGYVPVVVCGRDETTRAGLERLAAGGGRAVILGWTDRMPELMVACDALIENAGGLTSLEALKAGLPVISYQPIAGHGRENTSAMAAAGVSRLAGDRNELVVALDAVTPPGPERQTQVIAGRSMFNADGAALVLGTVEPAALARLTPPNRLRVAWASTSRRLSGVVAAAAMAWGGMTTGVFVATAFGAGVAHPAPGAARAAYIGVRLSTTELLDPAVDRKVRALGISVVVDHVTAFTAPGEVRQLAAQGVDIENGGRGIWLGPFGQRTRPALWTRAKGDVTAGAELSALIGRPVRFFVPGRRVNGFDLLDTNHEHDSIVVPDVEIAVADPDPAPLPDLAPREILLVNGLGATGPEVLAVLDQLQRDLARAHLTALPIAALT